MHDPGATVGHWTLKDCDRHAGRQFTFYVGDRPYHGDNGPEADDCDAVRLGAPVNEVYERRNPDNNVGGKLDEIPKVIANGRVNFLFPVGFSLLLFFFVVAPVLGGKALTTSPARNPR